MRLKSIVWMISQSKVIRYATYKYWEKKYNLSIGRNNNIGYSCKFEGFNRIADNCKLINSEFGLFSYTSNNVQLSTVKVGRYCAIGPEVRTVLGNHPTRKYVSIHPAFYSAQQFANATIAKRQTFEEYSYTDESKKYCIEIGNDVWIGASAIILNGCHIGDGAVVAAGSVVTRDVPPYTVVGGAPAKEIRKRFTEEQIDFLLKFQWWNRDVEWLREHAEDFDDIGLFMKKWKES